jgi:hypothetical protein
MRSAEDELIGSQSNTLRDHVVAEKLGQGCNRTKSKPIWAETMTVQGNSFDSPQKSIQQLTDGLGVSVF